MLDLLRHWIVRFRLFEYLDRLIRDKEYVHIYMEYVLIFVSSAEFCLILILYCIGYAVRLF